MDWKYFHIFGNRFRPVLQIMLVLCATVIFVVCCLWVGWSLSTHIGKIQVDRVTDVGKVSPKVENSRRLAPQRSFVRHDDDRRIVDGREMAR